MGRGAGRLGVGSTGAERRTHLGRKREGRGENTWQGPHQSESAGWEGTEVPGRDRGSGFGAGRPAGVEGEPGASNTKPGDGGPWALQRLTWAPRRSRGRGGESSQGRDSDPPSRPTDTCYVLSFSIIMLNTSLHNPNVRDKPPFERFVSMNRGINGGSDLPEDQLRVRGRGLAGPGTARRTAQGAPLR